jgi:site-specific DNA recombinase
MNSDQKTIHCAIYTRKSSEEGLEQSFNSLDAQREACEAFVLSQREEGWRVLPDRYDDGGYSGGNIERPGLQRLLHDIKDGKVGVIVVYKVDRLTRSLADFAKIVEMFDARGVSFVSVTQQFNTTTSMGPLTLNVLLSFAQFEREVTGERIRDKMAASKKKGMWMGGLIPLGYDVAGRKLVPNPKEVPIVNRIFYLYLKLGCVKRLAAQLRRENIRSKSWMTKKGNHRGGLALARGTLYYLLKNRVYIGETRHRDRWYPGEHESIVSRDVWDQVQARLASNLRTHRHRVREAASSLLTGMIQDAHGNRFTPSFTVKNGRRYRYYVCEVSHNKQRHGSFRLPAHELEGLITGRIISLLKSEADLFNDFGGDGKSPAVLRTLMGNANKLAEKWPTFHENQRRDLLAVFLERVVIHEQQIEVRIGKDDLRSLLESGNSFDSAEPLAKRKTRDRSELICLTIEAKRKHHGGEVHMVILPNSAPSVRHPKLSLIKAVARGRSWYERVLDGRNPGLGSLAKQVKLEPRYVRKVLAFAFLAPDIIESILDGRQPLNLGFAKLYDNIPFSWSEQRRRFGFPPVANR